jgi:hypothetical protein
VKCPRIFLTSHWDSFPRCASHCECVSGAIWLCLLQPLRLPIPDSESFTLETRLIFSIAIESNAGPSNVFQFSREWQAGSSLGRFRRNIFLIFFISWMLSCSNTVKFYIDAIHSQGPSRLFGNPLW